MKDGFSSSNGGAFLNNGILRMKSIQLQNNFQGRTPKAWSSTGTIIIYEGTVIIKD